MAMDVTPQTPTSGRKSSGYRRLQGRHREIIELYENLMKDHAALTAKHEELQLDVQRLLEQHTRLMQAVRSGPNWAEMPNWRPILTLPRCKGPQPPWPNFKTISLRSWHAQGAIHERRAGNSAINS